MDKKLKTRTEINQADKWDIEAMYPDETQWDADIHDGLAKAEIFAGYAGTLAKDSQRLLEVLKLRDEIWQTLEKAYVYARMRRDEDNTSEKYQAMTDRINTELAKVSAAMSFFTPELLETPEHIIQGFLKENEGLGIYKHAMDSLFREKAHVLTKSEENLLAQMSEITGSTEDIFTMLNNADLKFGTITGENGQTVELTHGNYITFMESHDRSVRKGAFDKMYQSYEALINTLATTYSYNTKTDAVSARIRKYSSSRAAALSGDNIPETVYDNLVSAVNENLPALHKYMMLRKKMLGVDALQMHDVYVPLVTLPKRDIPFEGAVNIMMESLAPLGDTYLEGMREGISQGWIDVYENQGKTSGAYSFGSYDSKPYILLNYTDTLKDVFTLVHEMGHSMHSYFTRAVQPFVYGGHSIFTAEVASTVNENLLMKDLLQKETDPVMRKYLLNMHIESFRTTLFRQTMFAEFEALTHKTVEEGGSLTAQWLSQEYNKLNKKYFGPGLAEDDYIQYEWARIPHFYRAFYVYKYATGYAAAAALSDAILKEGAPAKDRYLAFLKTGESDDPIELLKIAGVDMSSTKPVESAMEVFKNLVDEFERLV
jgi:oligoendopeptidase F